LLQSIYSNRGVLNLPDDHQQVTYHFMQDKGFDERSSFTILDEHYFVQCNEDHPGIFLRSESVDGRSIAGWSHEYGDGKVVCLTPAHNEDGLYHLDFIRVLRKSLLEVL